jgi:hypothetical protein
MYADKGVVAPVADPAPVVLLVVAAVPLYLPGFRNRLVGSAELRHGFDAFDVSSPGELAVQPVGEP